MLKSYNFLTYKERHRRAQAFGHADAENLLITFAEKNSMSARAYHRTLRLARTIADLQNSTNILKIHIAEALSYRHTAPET